MIMVVAPFAGRLTDRIGGRWLLFSGTLSCRIRHLPDVRPFSGTTETSLILPLAVCGNRDGSDHGSGYDRGDGWYSGPRVRYGRRYSFYDASDRFGDGYIRTGRHSTEPAGRNVENALSQVSQLPATLRDQITQGLTSGISVWAESIFPEIFPVLSRPNLPPYSRPSFPIA